MSAILSTPEIRTSLSSPTTVLTNRENVEGMSLTSKTLFLHILRVNKWCKQNSKSYFYEPEPNEHGLFQQLLLWHIQFPFIERKRKKTDPETRQ